MKRRKIIAYVMAFCMVAGMFSAVNFNTSAAVTNITNISLPTNKVFLTSNANTPVEGFLTVGNGFSAINCCNENVGNGNNLLGKTATTDEVAVYINLGADYNISSAKVYQGSTNANFYDSYCTNYNVYYSTEEVNTTNKGDVTWALAGTCTNGTIYAAGSTKYTTASATNQSTAGDTITFTSTYKAKSVKFVFDKESCMGTGTNGNNTGKTGTVSLLSLRVYGEEVQTEAPSESQTTAPIETTTQASEIETITQSDDLTIYESFDTNLARGKNAYASSNDRGSRPTTPLKVSNLTDGSNTSYIVTHENDSAPWYAVNLGSVQDINKVVVVPGGDGNYANSYPINYEIQIAAENKDVSNPSEVTGLTWTTVATVTDGTLMTKEITFARKNTRWVRVKVNSKSADTCSVEELYVYATDDSKVYTEPINILFIGNSMTYYNNLANVVKGIATLNNKKFNVTAATNGGKNLIYQSTADNVDSAIKAGGYDYVILQDIVGSFDATNLTNGAAACIAKIRQYNPDAQLIFYEPWPVKGRLMGEETLLPYFTESYITTSRANNARLAPAGETFYDIYERGYDYYCDDEKHPLPLGTFISASTIYYTIFNNDAYAAYTNDNVAAVRDTINNNIAYSGAASEAYALDLLNLINERGYHYAHAVADAAADTTGNTSYTSIAEAEDYNVTIDGTVVETVREGNSFTLPTSGDAYHALGYINVNDDSVVYKPGTEVEITDDLNLIGIDAIQSISATTGASIKMNKSTPGIAFKATASFNGGSPINNDAVTYGMLLTTNDIFGEQLDENLSFESPNASASTMLNVEFGKNDWIDAMAGTYRAGVLNVNSSNLVREFLARAYVKITYNDGTSTIIYSPQPSAVRSIKEVAQNIKADTDYYNSLTGEQRDAIDTFADAQ